jgi:hypothetical protein
MFGLPIRDTQEDFGLRMSTDMITIAPQSNCKDASRQALRGPCGAWRPSGSYTIAQIID